MPTRSELANAIRMLAVDAVEHSNSGHPGMPLGMADIAEVLWNDFLCHNPENPQWLNRDRFILSNGHGCMLQYALLHLTGYDVSMKDISQFRQLDSKTPGHPEYGITPGVEATTGPLGQGIANGIGMALAEKLLAATFNRDGYEIIDHYTYVFLGDGCLMEGISHEACSLAGTLGLGKLIAFWDNNHISIDGEVAGWFTDDTPLRFAAYGWQVIADVDGHDADAIRQAIFKAQQQKDRPTLICCTTIIGYGAPKLAGKHHSHGAPLGEEEIVGLRHRFNWPYPPFIVPEEIYDSWDAKEKGKKFENEWNLRLQDYKKNYPELYQQLLRRRKNELPNDWQQALTDYIEKITKQPQHVATRKSSQQILNLLAPLLPELLGGSADLTASNLTDWQGSKAITKDDFTGNYLHYGVREFAMFAIMNGLALHGGFIPYGGTFLTFIDYGRNALRLAAMMKKQVILVLTHDSIGLGEDGPTHQPIEHASMLRMTPNVEVWRPCDGVETAVAWQRAITRQNGPTCLLLSRQAVPQQVRAKESIVDINRGGYVLYDSSAPQIILLATGSEVDLAVKAAKLLPQHSIRVVSMPAVTVFLQQSSSYQSQVLPKIGKRIAIEAGASDYWYKLVGHEGKIIGLNDYGKSAPADVLFKALGITVEAIVQAIENIIKL